MNILFRLIALLMMSVSFTPPAGAAVAVDVYNDCGVIAADDDKKSGDKKPEGDTKPGDEEPECD